MIIPRNPSAAPNHDAAYETDTEGRFCIMQIRRMNGKTYHSVMPAPRFRDVAEADRYCIFFNWFLRGIEFTVCEVENVTQI